MTDLSKLAASLSEAQRRAVLQTPEDDLCGYDELRGHTRVALFRKGVFASHRAGGEMFFSLTDAGLQLRSYLQEMDRG